MTRHDALRKKRIVEYIAATVRDHGYPPSVREIAAAVGLAIFDQGIKTQKSTLRDVFILFIGFFIGWARLNDPFSNDGSIWFLLIGAMTAVTGIILVQRIEWPWKKRLKQVFFPPLRD